MNQLIKPDPTLPALKVEGLADLRIRAGMSFAGVRFDVETEVEISGLEPGMDYVVLIRDGAPVAVEATGDVAEALGGFHFAPGGNAESISGGDEVPAINRFSLWDQNFRPACADPRGMVLVTGAKHPFWCDIYLTGVDHLMVGTSAFGAVIADGANPPLDHATGQPFDGFNYATACAVMKHHGKGLLSFEEFAVAAYGVTERSAARKDPRKTKLDAPRTSRFGLMQATGNMWTWGHDGHPDAPRASVLGGSWLSEGNAGSRYANLGYWAGYSLGVIGARGRSDHLQLG
jgi:hypothetical protein